MMEMKSPTVLRDHRPPADESAPPVRFRIVTESDRSHHVFAVHAGSERWWHWRANFDSRARAEEFITVNAPWRDSLEVRLETNEAEINGVAHRLPPKLCEVFFVLNERFGKVISYTQIVAQVWPDHIRENQDSDHLNELKVYVSKIRTILKTSPFMVETIWAKGYALKERTIPSKSELVIASEIAP